MASASDHRAHAALQPADCLILLPQRLPAAVETSLGPAHYPAECTQSDAFLQPSLRARYGRANSNSFLAIARSLVPLYVASKSDHDRLLNTKQLAESLETGRLTLRDVFADCRSRDKGTRILLIADAPCHR